MINENNSSNPSIRSAAESQALTNAFLVGVYKWMAIGLAVTAGVAMYTAGNERLLDLIFTNTILLIGLVVAQLGLVVALSAAINKLSATTATALFILYSALTGLTLSTIFIVYTASSIASTFVASAGMFGAMSLYGLMTKKDLTSLGSLCFMGLIGIIIAMIVNIFLKSDMMGFIISGIGVLVFLGLTAYDTQKLRNMGENAPTDDPTALRRGTILGALTLYLDFINLFLMLLRLFGQRR